LPAPLRAGDGALLEAVGVGAVLFGQGDQLGAQVVPAAVAQGQALQFGGEVPGHDVLGAHLRRGLAVAR
jgi:hypothetical protein